MDRVHRILDRVRRILDSIRRILDRVRNILDRVRRILDGLCRILDGLAEYWTDYLTSRSTCMAIPPPACFKALVVAKQANATETQDNGERQLRRGGVVRVGGRAVRRGSWRGGLAGWGVPGLHKASRSSSAGGTPHFPPQQPSSEQPPGGAG